MSPTLRNWLAFSLLAVAAAAVRLPDLGKRPMHTDEAVNAYITGQILAGEPFRYDPQDRHGPALFAVTAPLARLAGATSLAALDEVTLRRTAVLLGALVVLALGLLVRPLGFVPALIAAACWTLAPASLYYGRYIIHESGYIAATVLFLAGLLRWTEGARWPVVCGIGAALMLAFKETAVIAWAAAGLALLAADAPGCLRRLKDARGLMSAVAAALLLIVISFTWGGANLDGLALLLRAVTRFAARAGGEGHEKPWSYYVLLMAFGKSGPLLFVAAAAGAWRAWRSGPAGRFWIGYAFLSIAVHAAIPYKTPWLVLGQLLPLFVLAGIGLAVRPVVAVSGGLALLALFAFDGRRVIWRDPAGERNPFAYAHTSEDLLRLPEVVAAWQKRQGRDPVIAVVADDPWPLPWYLRAWPRVGYWRPGQDPGAVDIYITDLAPGDAVQPRVETLIPEYFGLRPGTLLILWAQKRAAGSQ